MATEGYTHKVYFDKYVPKLGVVVRDQYFSTTPDMVNRHVDMLSHHPGITNVRSVEIAKDKT